MNILWTEEVAHRMSSLESGYFTGIGSDAAVMYNYLESWNEHTKPSLDTYRAAELGELSKNLEVADT